MGNETADYGQKRTFDWQAMSEQIASASAALHGMDEMAPEAMQELWARRAAKLAQVPADDVDGKRIDLVLIRLGREIYGLEAIYVSDIKPLEQITRVPRVPDWVAGVVNQRGRIYSVVNLQRFFKLPAAESEGQTAPRRPFLLMVEIPEMEVALLADDVLSIEAIPAARIKDAIGTVRGLPPEYVRGVARRQNRDAKESAASSLLVVLDLPTILADERLIVREEIV